MQPPTISKRLKYGSTLVLIAGSIPFLVGLSTVFFVWLSVAQPDKPWRAIMPPGTEASFTLNDIRKFNKDLGDEFVMAKHVHYCILTAVGLLIMVLSLFGLRRREKWAWLVLVVTILLVGWNDAITTLSYGQLPFPIVPALLATIGLGLCWSEIFRNPDTPS